MHRLPKCDLGGKPPNPRLKPTKEEQSSWFVSGDEENGITGAQIDLLIDRRDHTVSVCEMKFSRGEFEIKKDYDLNLRNKVETFRIATNCKKSIQLVMVTMYGVRKNKYSGLIQNQVTLDDLFIEC